AQYAVDRKHDAIDRKNLFISNDNLIAECLSKEAQNDLFRAEDDKIKQHCKELYDSIKITRAKHIEQVTKLTAENVTLKTSVSKAKVQPPVFTRTKHAVDVEPIIPRLRNNRDAHLDYLRHLKESVEIIRDIVEEAKVVRPLDRSIVSACRYTKHSQELLEYAIGTCPQRSQQQAKQLAHTPLIRKKQVTATKPSDRQDSNKHKHVVTQKTQKTNVPVSYSTGVKSCPKASGSQPKSNPKTNRISPSKGANKLPVEDLPGTNKSQLRTMNRVDSSSRLKRTRKHRFHPRSDSSVHLSNEEHVLGYLKFSAKGTKSEVFGMPIPDSLITTEIQHATYYREYLAKNSPKFVGASEAEEVPAEEPQVADKDADYQKALEESMKDAYDLPKGPLPPVVIRKPESGKYQPLPVVPRKGKAKVTKEQVAHDLLSLQNHKKKSPVDQYIFQRRVSEPTGSFRHDESPYALLGQSNNKEESEKVVLRAEEGSQDEAQAGPDPDAQAEDQTGSDTGDQAEGQARSNPDETSKGQAGPDPGDAEAKVQSISSPMVHARSDHEYMDLDVADVSPQPSTEQLDEGLTATVYPNIQENLKLAVEELVLLEEPTSSSGTLSSLQHLSRDFSFGDQFFSEKHSDADKNAKTEVESMEHQQLKVTTTDTTTTTTTTLPPPQAPQQSTTEAMMVKRI
nr:integrase, catalytic region, zinc finger, CCHC-type, peptidase aspartic, catalytic [Tanacetum cinerariifolium]